MTQDIDIRDAVVLFGKDVKKGLLAIVTYAGGIGAQKPLEIHVDTQLMKISVLFESGESRDICPITPENTDFVRAFCARRDEAGDVRPLRIGFYAVDEKHRLIDPCYDVDALVI